MCEIRITKECDLARSEKLKEIDLPFQLEPLFLSYVFVR